MGSKEAAPGCQNGDFLIDGAFNDALLPIEFAPPMHEPAKHFYEGGS